MIYPSLSALTDALKQCQINHVSSGECCFECSRDYFANRCPKCGTKLPCSLEKYLLGRNAQFQGSDERVYGKLHK
jgi:hypothetical protein